MSIFKKARHCTSQIPCRYKLATMLFCAAIVASAVAVPFISDIVA